MLTFTSIVSVAAAMVVVANAIPMEVEERQIGAQTAGFDDLATPTVVSLNSVGVYQGLNYTGISLASQRISAFAGLVPQSPANDIYYSTVSSLTPAGAPPQVTIPTNAVGLFTPTSIYFGCTVSVPVPCTFTVTGSRNDKETAQQTFQFTPTTYPAALQQAVLTAPGFVGVDKIEFSSVYKVFGVSVPGSTVLDTFSYVITAI
ncbi:hypothetical protein N0V93_008436 [Gnomoniopsis smithogilvyi]|uniref:Uncharacterized protein n=1 Tax=Gnomoniopsis smithogilvyi TaxID=1191159 RepID=A0A9W8YP54_9PEZI|nr:hypothetical protein N0V93_008436 [Gnomoniopsis smithogilvyi]